MNSLFKKIKGEVIEKIGMVVLAILLASAATVLISHAFSNSANITAGGSFDVGVRQGGGLGPASGEQKGDGENDSGSDGESSPVDKPPLVDSEGNIRYDGEGYDPDGTIFEDIEDWIASRPEFEGSDDEVAEQEWRYYYPSDPEDFFEFGEWDGKTGGIPIKSSSATGYVYIPDKINGSFVTRIANDAFRNNQGLLGISMPGTIYEIGVGAFEGANELYLVEFRGRIEAEALELPNLTIIGNHAFGDTTKLKHLYISGEPEMIGNQAFTDSPDLIIYMEMEHPGYVTTGNSTYVGKDEWHRDWHGNLDPETQIVWGVSQEDFHNIVVSDWISGYNYSVGDIVRHNGYYWIVTNAGEAQQFEPGEGNPNNVERNRDGWNRLSSRLHPDITSGGFLIRGDHWIDTNTYTEVGQVVYHKGSYWIVTNYGEANSHEPGQGNSNNTELNRDGWNKISDKNHPEILDGALIIQGEPWLETNTYSNGDVVYHEGVEWIAVNLGANMPEPGHGPEWQPYGDGHGTETDYGITILEWNPHTMFEAGDVVSYDGSYWIAHVNWATWNTPSLSAGTGWNKIVDPSNIVNFNVPEAEYIPTNLYHVNDIVTFNGNLYRATSQVSGADPVTGSWAWQLIK